MSTRKTTASGGNRTIDPDAILLAGRVLLATLYLVGGFLKIKYLPGAAAYMKDVGIPGAGEPLALAAGVLEIACATAILAGYRTRAAAACLFVYLIPITWYTHLAVAWNAADAAARDEEVVQTLKNAAVMGGMALLFLAGAGRHSIDER